ncbi:hypothetical protein JCM10908_004576 [Rhodotorula pacifica]|uniref:uncharacterized protein n=1 Tax=Rhodotorula pacifica TaxID=1495444 RepID=UPI003181A51F
MSVASDDAASPDPASGRPPLFAPPSTAATDLYADQQLDDSMTDMLDDDTDNDSVDVPLARAQQAQAEAGPGPSTLAHRGTHNASTSNPTPAKKRKSRPSAGGGGGGGGGGPYFPPPLPHYTVIRSSHNSKSSPHRICINQAVTDADESRWPSTEECQPTHKVDGKTNWYECQPKDGMKHKAFRDKIGEELAKSLKLAKGSNEYWTLDALPEHYLFTVHHSAGGGKPRTDTYVWGNPKVLKFRTANEMTPHIYWLLEHGPHDSLTCMCKYCSKMTQGDVNRHLGLPLKQTGIHSGDGGSSSAARGASPGGSRAASPSGPRVKNPVNYAYKPSPLAMHGGATGSGPSSTSSGTSGYNGGAAARVAGFNDVGGEKLLGPNATPAAIARAKHRHAKAMEEKDARKRKHNKGKGKERDDGGPPRKRKKNKHRRTREGSATNSNASRGGSESSPELSDLTDLSDVEVDVDGAGEGGEFGPTYRGAFTNRMRDEDLNRVSAPRRGELVWAELPRPLVGRRKGPLEGKVVTHWPGIVESREVRSEAVVLPSSDATKSGKKGALNEDDDDEQEEAGAADGEPTPPSTSSSAEVFARPGTTLRMQPPPRLHTATSTRYTIKLFAIADTIRLLREDQVLPWLHHAPPRTLFAEFGALLQEAEAVKHIWNGKTFMRDTVLFEEDGVEEEEEGPPLEETLAPLGLAMQIASHVLTTFTLNDKYNVTARFLTPVDPTDPIHQQEREKQLKSWAYQATHFGAELVWTGDFVRIFETEGNPFEGLRYESPPISWGKRALFMKVFAIYKDNEVGEEVGEVKLAGELWELRDFGTTAGVVQDGAGGEGATSDGGDKSAVAATAASSVAAADGQSAMSMFEKRPSPAAMNGSTSSAAPKVAGTPSTPPDTPPAKGSTAAAAAADGDDVAAPARAGPAMVDTEGMNLPPPPAGFYLFRLTSSTEQVHVTLDFLAGRYHPLPKELNTAAKIRETLDRLQLSEEDELEDNDARAMLLAGLGPAYKLFNKCGMYIGDRRTALVAATQHAESEAKPILEEGTAASIAAAERDNADAQMAIE